MSTFRGAREIAVLPIIYRFRQPPRKVVVYRESGAKTHSGNKGAIPTKVFPSPNLPFPLNLVQSTRKSGFDESKSDVSFSLFFAFVKRIGKKRKKEKKNRWKAIACDFFFPHPYSPRAIFTGVLARTDASRRSRSQASKQTKRKLCVSYRA